MDHLSKKALRKQDEDGEEKVVENGYHSGFINVKL